MSNQSLFRLSRGLDILIACILMLFSFLLIVRSAINNNYTYMPIVIFLSSFIYILFNQKFLQFLQYDVNVFKSKYIYTKKLLSTIIFIICLISIIYISFINLYYRPPVYFILIIFASITIIFDIFCLDDKPANIRILSILLKIIMLSFIINYTLYYQFPGFPALDPWIHDSWINETILKGHVTSGDLENNSYFYMPIFHILIAISQILMSITSRDSLFLLMGLCIAITNIFIFFIGKKFVNLQVGLLATLLYSLIDYKIFWSVQLIPFTLGYIYMILILYISIAKQFNPLIKYLIISIIYITLIFTHTIAALSTLVCLIGVYIVDLLYKISAKDKNKNISILYIIPYALLMFFIWSCSTNSNSPSFFQGVIVRLMFSIEQYSKVILSMSPDVIDNIYIVLINDMSYLLILFFGIIGTFIYLNRKNRSKGTSYLIFIAGIIFVFIYSFTMLNLGNILPERWFIFLYIPLSILSIIGILNFSHALNKKMSKIITSLIIVFIIFMTIIDTNANLDSPLFFNGAIRQEFTQSEITALNTLSSMDINSLLTDQYYESISRYIMGKENYTRMLNNKNSLTLVLRGYYINNPDWNKNYSATMIDDRYSYIYTNGYVSNATNINDFVENNNLNKGPLIYNNGKTIAYLVLNPKDFYYPRGRQTW